MISLIFGRIEFVRLETFVTNCVVRSSRRDGMEVGQVLIGRLFRIVFVVVVVRETVKTGKTYRFITELSHFARKVSMAPQLSRDVRGGV